MFHFENIIYPLHDESYRMLNVLYQIFKSKEELDSDIINLIYAPSENTFKAFITSEPESESKINFIPIAPFEKKEDSEELNLPKMLDNDMDVSETCYHFLKRNISGFQWILYSFMPVLPAGSDFKNERKYFIKRFPDLVTWIENGLTGSQKISVKGFFNKIFPKLVNHSAKAIDNEPFNRSSVLLYSGLIKPASAVSNKMIFQRSLYPHLYDCILCFCNKFRYRTKPKKTEDKHPYALLLTGDAELKSNQDWQNYLKIKDINDQEIDLRKNITIVNLPHHGSKKNMNDATFKNFDNIEYFLTFAGNRTFPYKDPHPNIEAMNSAIQAQPKANIIHVNQLQGLYEEVHIF